MVFILVLLFLAAGFCQRQVSAVTSSCTGHGHSRYTVRLEGYNLGIGISCQSESCKEILQARLEVQPLVHISTCPAPQSKEQRNTSLALLAAAQEVHSGEDYNYWKLELSEYFQGTRCIDVRIGDSILGPGPTIAETRTQLWFELPGVSTTNQMAACVSNEQESCEILDTSVYATTVILTKEETRFFVEYLDSGYRNVLPPFAVIQAQALCSNCSPCWILIEDNQTAAGGTENHVLFTPSRVYAVSKNELFIAGNSLLYSPNRGDTFYRLLLPHCEYQIGSFAFSHNRIFAFTVPSNETTDIWVGFTGSTEVLQVYPSDVLQRMWERCNFTWEDSTLRDATLLFDSQGDLQIVNRTASMKLPLPTLVSSAVNILYRQENVNHSYDLPWGVSVNLTPFHPPTLNKSSKTHHKLLTDGLHELYAPLQTCPFVEMHVEATSCSSVTRSKLHLVKEGVLRWIDEFSLADNNCNISANNLPKEIFIGKSTNYTFLVHFMMSLSIPDLTSFYFVAMVSDLEVVAVEMRKSFHSTNNTMTYQVTLSEQNQYTGQFESGYTATTLDIDFQVLGAATKCIDPLSDHLKQPGHLHMRMHIGCPPGLSLAFDAEMTSAQQSSQYCNPTNDVNCYYFGHEFYPIFQTVDSLTEEHSIYAKPYTLRAIAGGTRLNNMKYFNRNESVESSMWAPVNDSKEDNVYHYGDNGIKWVCGTSSPCGEIVPNSGRVPEYFLLLEASNRGVGEIDTYCDLTVQFLIRIHGMGMGSVTVVVTLLCILVVFAVMTVCVFALWHFRLKVLYFRDRAVEICRENISRIAEQIRRRTHHSSRDLQS